MTPSKLPNIALSIDLIKELYHIHISKLNCNEAIQDYYNQFHYHKSQSIITVESLRNYLLDYKDEILYLTDSLMMHHILFHIEETPFIMGPFCSVMMSSRDVKLLFEQHHITDLTEPDFFSYYNQFPVMTEAAAIHIVDSIYQVINRATNQKKIHKINSRKTTIEDYENLMANRKHNYELLEKRYANEQRFLLDIEKGNSKNAILDLHNMQADVQYFKNLGTTLQNEKIGAAITRTTVRLAAFRAGLPIILIDQISRKNTITTKDAKTVNDILEAKENMIREFCSAILDNKQNQYSALVQSMIYFFEHEYYTEISLDELSNDLNVSKNHLISTFRKETGVTPIVYLRNIRLKQAAVLLSGSNYSIEEIAESVGIGDANYFIKLFKNQYDMTPNAYRKKYI